MRDHTNVLTAETSLHTLSLSLFDDDTRWYYQLEEFDLNANVQVNRDVCNQRPPASENRYCV